MSTCKAISIQVPEDSAAGDTLSFVIDGKELEISLPDGCQPNDVLQIQVEVRCGGAGGNDTPGDGGDGYEDEKEKEDENDDRASGKQQPKNDQLTLEIT
jgi:hypothetical protein